MGPKAIGMAADFYRVRVRRLDESGDVQLEWRDDILYKGSAPARDEGVRTFVIQAVELDDPDRVHEIASASDYDEALGLVRRAEEDLAELTRSRFEAAWMTASLEP